MTLIDEIKHDVQALFLLRDWLGDGCEPVSRFHAEYRSLPCVKGQAGEPCQFNTAPNWWDEVKDAIAETIRSELELKKQLELHVTEEPNLHMCKICGCCLKLKVWTPIQYIKAHTSPENIERMPAFCWQRREIERY